MPNHLSADPFVERRRSLEEAFFKEKDRQLLDKLRSELFALEETKQLAHVSGIVEHEVLDHLFKAGVKAETLAAVAMIPLVEVAWVDGSISAEERNAVLNAAAAEGIGANGAAYELLQAWLGERPDPNILIAWKDYVREVSRLMPREVVAELKRMMIQRTIRVAESAGGFLGLAAVSKSERRKIDELAEAYGV
jgi:hypothetical protein